MYATIRSYSGSSDFGDALVANEDAVRSTISTIPGFRAYYLIRAGDGTTSVSVFDDEAGCEASTQAAAAWVRENLADVAPGQPEVTTGEVAVSF
jgi:heme-degrading monooxygenase HmoA